MSGSRFDASVMARAMAAVGLAAARPPEPPAQPPQQQAPDQSAEALVLGLCRRFEGLHLSPYLCPAGVPTIGYGATYYLDGRRVTLSDPAITRVHAEVLLREMIRREYMPAVRTLCPGADTPGRVAALCDFAFNLGVGNLKASTLRRRVNAGAWAEVPGELMRWNKAGGRVLRGLTIRRQSEADLI